MRTLLYDSDCGFCRTILGAILMRDRDAQILPVALQDALAADLLPGMSEEDRFASFHLVGDDGTILSGGRALSALLRDLPGARPFGAAMAAVQPLTDAFYKVISANRSRIGPLVPGSWRQRADATIARRQAELGG
ncbi:MAG: thiol-disulfide oxidoreductase DCC family protein [Solirubrobacterales bacterium]